MTTLTVRFHPVALPARTTRSGLAAMALRASSANGFGDGVVATPVPPTAVGRWQRRELRLFAQLDATTLRDLGIEPGELPSLAAELHGTAAATRRWTERAHADIGAARLRINSVDSYR